MTAHMHREITPGCYRCDLNLDEIAAAEQWEAEEAAREAACPQHDWMDRGAPGYEYRECFLCGAQEERCIVHDQSYTRVCTGCAADQKAGEVA